MPGMCRFIAQVPIGERRTGMISLVIALNLPAYDTDCVFVRDKVTTNSRSIDLRELSAEKEDLR